MADDTQTTLNIIDGNGVLRSVYVTISGGSNYTFQSTPRINGAQVDITNPMPTLGKQTSLTLVPLDISTVTTGGTAVTALSAGHRTAGGWIFNPGGTSGTASLGINEIGTASGTTSVGNTTFIAAGQTYTLAASTNAVSVISADSGHAFSGVGFQ
jgi:hypothetical protein